MRRSLARLRRREVFRFVDRARVRVEGGCGGDGCVSFQNFGNGRKIPNGGNGGQGGDVFLVADKATFDLSLAKRHFKAENGGNGGSSQMAGKGGRPVVIKVPLGTVVKRVVLRHNYFGDYDRDYVDERDLDTHLAATCVARGGRGGIGNDVEASGRRGRSLRVHKSPGSHGSVAFLDLELKTIAGVGLVGFPNAGKSSLLRCLSNARPKVADYPFTTVHPNIGTVEYSDGEQVSMADIPGLIGGASENRGMGHDFLRHIERTRLLVYVIDVSSYAEHRALGVKDPAAPPPSTQFELLRNELYKYSPTLLEKRHIVVANKMDVEGAAEGLAELEAGLKANAAAGDFAELYADVPGVGEGREAAPPPVYAISAKRGLEVGRLAKAIRREYESVCAEDEAAQDGEDDELMADGDYAGAAPPSFESGVKEYGVEVFYVGSGDLPPDVQQQLLDDPN